MTTALVELPVFAETPLYDYRVALTGVEYRIAIDYNGREDRWYLALYDADGELVAGSRKIVCGKPLLRHARHLANCPAGELIALDSKGTLASPGEAPSWSEFGQRVKLYYGSVTDVAATTSDLANPPV